MGEQLKAADFARYYKYEELVGALRTLAAAYPNLVDIYPIGKSYEGRDIWAIELTNKATGRAEDKPAFYIDANIHAGEVTGCAVAMYTAAYLLTNYGSDPQATRLLDRRTWYIIPRISVDGAEVYLTTPKTPRSSVRPYPEEEQSGLILDDVNGDGLILQMRIEDPDGEWKVSDEDPRLMVRRRPDDFEGRFYRLLPEGFIKDFDGVEIKYVGNPYGLDINRNWPSNWEQEYKQRGAGPFPLSEPETKAVADFILAHPNIGGVMAYHTQSGAILRPSCTKPDAQMNPKDVAAYRAIGELGSELTGYPAINTFEEFTGKVPLKGVFMDWVYEHLGVLAFSTELWNPARRAGVTHGFDQPNTDEDNLKLLRWNDRELAGEGFADWRPFDHPQLGRVEIGGWKSKFVLQNPPPQLLLAECHKNMLFTLKHADALPILGIDKLTAAEVGAGVYKITAVVKNHGFLPTNISEVAKEIRVAKPVTVEIVPGEGAQLVHGQAKTEIGHLEGRLTAPSFYGSGVATLSKEKRVEWLVRGEQGSKVKVVASSPRAGVVTKEVVL